MPTVEVPLHERVYEIADYVDALRLYEREFTAESWKATNAAYIELAEECFEGITERLTHLRKTDVAEWFVRSLDSLPHISKMWDSWIERTQTTIPVAIAGGGGRVWLYVPEFKDE